MTQFNNNFDHELGWDDEITTDAKEFVQLAPGDYQFTVTNLERGRHTKPTKSRKIASLQQSNYYYCD